MTTDEQMEAAVHAYVAGFDAGDVDSIVALFAADGSAEDPVGTSPIEGHDALHAFYAASMETGAKLHLDGPVRIAAGHAAFPFHVSLNWKGSPIRIDVIDVFRFDDQGKIAEMRAFFGPRNSASQV